MISALRLTMTLLWLPAVSAAALQVPPARAPRPIAPRTIEPRVTEPPTAPRPFEPRVVEPLHELQLLDKWHDLDLQRFEFHDKLFDLAGKAELIDLER